jgi:hypothetical protein
MRRRRMMKWRSEIYIMKINKVGGGEGMDGE